MPISWRAWWLWRSRGEMPVSDWLGGYAEPERPLPWNARVVNGNDLPVLFIGRHDAGYIIWPDGKMEEKAINAIEGFVMPSDLRPGDPAYLPPKAK